MPSPRLDLVEAAAAEEQLAQHEQSPALAEDRERAGDRSSPVARRPRSARRAVYGDVTCKKQAGCDTVPRLLAFKKQARVRSRSWRTTAGGFSGSPRSGCSCRASTCSSSTSPSPTSQLDFAGTRSASSPGSSTPTRSSSRRCSSPPAASPTGSAASAVFLAGLALFGARLGRCAPLAPSVAALVAARVFQAAGGAMMLPASLGLILPAFPPEQRAVAVSIWSAVGGDRRRARAPDRRSARRGRAGAGSSSSTCRSRWSRVVAAVVALHEVARSRPGRPARTASAPCWLIGAVGLLTTGDRPGPASGAGATPAWSAPSPPPSRSAPPSSRARARHPAPVIELPLLRVRSFATANAATMVFFAGFASMLLAGVAAADPGVGLLGARRPASR